MKIHKGNKIDFRIAFENPIDDTVNGPDMGRRKISRKQTRSGDDPDERKESKRPNKRAEKKMLRWWILLGICFGWRM